MMAFTKVFKAISNGVRQNTSDFRSWDKTGALWIALPSLKEQEAIADFLDAEVEKIKYGISALQKEIDVLKEYRARLISDVVTGQMDVRNVVIPEYEMEYDLNPDESEESEDTLCEEVNDNE